MSKKLKRKKIIRLNFNHKHETLVCMMEDCSIKQFNLSTLFEVDEEWDFVIQTKTQVKYQGAKKMKILRESSENEMIELN